MRSRSSHRKFQQLVQSVYSHTQAASQTVTEPVYPGKHVLSDSLTMRLHVELHSESLDVDDKSTDI